MGAILNGEVGFMHLELWLRLHHRRWIGEGEKSLRTTVRQYLAGGGGVSILANSIGVRVQRQKKLLGPFFGIFYFLKQRLEDFFWKGPYF